VKLDLRNESVEYGLLDDQVVHWLLHGQISSSLLALGHLEHLDLSGNFLGGNMSIPEFIGSLKTLTYLDLSNMNFIGRVPPQLGNLTKLVYLDIHKDSLYPDAFAHAYSSDVSWLASLHSLQQLDMSGVNLSAAVDWVHAVNNLPNLRVLYLGYCSLTSSTPSLLHNNLTVLEELYLFSNPFNSPTAPNWYWDVTSLKSLDMEGCGLSGPFPDELGNLTMLEDLDMGWNSIEGMIPSTLKNLCRLQMVYLAGNNIGGDITDLIQRLPNCSWDSLQELFLFRTNMTGTTLKSVLNLTALSVLYIQDNLLSGSVPVEIGTLKYLTGLHIGNNSFSGVISEAHFSSLTNLESIDLSHTNLKVVVAPDWKPPFDLETADLSSCRLGPQFPSWLRWQKSILYLEMPDAGLIGRIPNWFWTTFSNAMHLDLSYNQLSGELPVNLEFMSVQELFLRSNHLTGSIPQLPTSIVLLDISKNSLSGQLPSNFGAPYLQVAAFSTNCITGTVSYSFCQWPHLRVLDLSNNLLTGGLPDCGKEELKQRNAYSNNSSRVNSTNSHSLEIRTLRLNNNHLSGGFPLLLKQCQNMVFLDLTQNTLPTWISEDMPRLVILRLKSNNFFGHIPIEITLFFLFVFLISQITPFLGLYHDLLRT
jgi:Leucine-rich repeat (LRR) protein